MGEEYKLNIRTCIIINEWQSVMSTFIYDFELLGIQDYDSLMNFIDSMDKFSNNRLFMFKNRSYLDFYEKYKYFIDALCSSSKMDTYEFFRNLFEEKESYLNYISYLQDNILGTDRINRVINKIRELGFNTIYYSPSYSFDEEYTLYPNSFYEDIFMYLDGIKIQPTYDYSGNEIKYKGTNSNYLMRLRLTKNKSVRLQDEIIKVNSLIFDPDLLPDELNYYETYHQIITEKQKCQSEYDSLKEIVGIKVGVKDLNETLKGLNTRVKSMDNINNDPKYASIIEGIQTAVSELENYANQLVDEQSKVSGNINHDTVEEQTNRYVRKRELAKIDID